LKNRGRLYLYLAIACFIGLIVVFGANVYSNTLRDWAGKIKLTISPNYLDTEGWSKRVKFNISGSSAGAQANYQMKLTVHKDNGTAGSPNANDVYFNNHCKDDFSDIRFTKSDGKTKLDYWIEEYTSGDNAIVWVEFDRIPADPDTATFFIYYDNPDATSESSGANTFLFFDDFASLDTEVWTVRAGYYSASGGELYLGDNDGGGNARSYIAHLMTLPTNYRLHYRGKSTGTENEFVVYHTQDGNYLTTTDRLAWNDYGASGSGATHCIYVGNSAYDNQDVPLVQNAYYNFRVTVLDKTYAFARYVDHTDTLVAESGYTDSATRSRDSLGLHAYDYGTRTLVCDWIFVGNYVEPEPAFSSWGSEETA